MQMFIRVEWGEIIKKNFFESFVRIAEVYFFNFQEGVITFAFFRWANLACYSITGTKIEPPDLGRGNIDIVRSRQIVIIRARRNPNPSGNASRTPAP